MIPDTLIITSMAAMKRFTTTSGSWKRTGRTATSGNCTTTTGGNIGSGGTNITIMTTTRAAKTASQNGDEQPRALAALTKQLRPVFYFAEASQSDQSLEM